MPLPLFHHRPRTRREVIPVATHVLGDDVIPAEGVIVLAGHFRVVYRDAPGLFPGQPGQLVNLLTRRVEDLYPLPGVAIHHFLHPHPDCGRTALEGHRASGDKTGDSSDCDCR